MQTRSQTRKQNTNELQKRYEYEVNINFDEAINAWKENKKKIGNGCYAYICCVDKNGKKCGSKCMDGKNCCRTHYTPLNI